jgi:hypothetical protein
VQAGGVESSALLDKDNRWFARPGAWFWSAMAIGAAIRIYLVVCTEGTYDVGIWAKHADGVRQLGLIGYYHSNPEANHPPLISVIESLLLRCSESTHVPFRILLRAPFALLDAGTTLLLFVLLPATRWRFVAAASYWLNPLAMILSSYHGNTDSAVAFFLLLCVWLLSKEKTIGAGMAVGASLCIKLPGLLAIPALVLFIQGWRRRLVFLFVTGAVAAVMYLPAMLQDTPIVYKNVIAYRGQIIQTTAGVPVWGPQVLLFSVVAPAQNWPQASHKALLFLLRHSWRIAIILLLMLTWLRRSRRSVPDVCATLAMVYVIVYAFIDSWAFQYFAWSLPFWFFLPAWFVIPAILLAGGYIYSLYWVLCGNSRLLGTWDFVGHPYWPEVVIWFRNAAVIFFFATACVFIGSAIWQQLRRSPRSTAL